MKKFFLGTSRVRNKHVLKVLIMSKCIVLLILVSAFQTFSKGFSQDKISLNLQNASLRKAFKEIEKKTQYRFLFNDALLSQSQNSITLKVENTTIDKVMPEILSDSKLTYKVSSNLVIIARPEDARAEVQKISGKVTSKTGEPLIGVSVKLKGSSLGTSTDAEGKYSLNLPGADGILIFTYVGFISKEVAVDGRTTINIVLEEDTRALNEVVVVGYGTQKKTNLTGSVSSISATELENRPITQASQALAGLATGVTVSQGSGRPGNDGASVKIRGLGTFSGAGTDPLVLIDGLAANINDIDPNNIKSISVLKDAASAAIYGTRAANGVILIETKRGQKGKFQINYNNYAGWQNVTALPQFVDSWEYATMTGQLSEQIAKYKDGSDPDNYPNVPHLKNLLNSGSGFQTNHTLSFMGGDDKNSYLFSVGYLRQNGVVAENDYSKYNLGLNFDSKLRKNLQLKLSLNGYKANTDEPRSTGDMQNMIAFAVREPNSIAGKKSDGTYGYQDDFAPEAWLASESFANRKNNNFLGGAELSWEVVKGLTLSGKAGYNYRNNTDNDFTSTFKFNATKTYGPNFLNVISGDNSLVTLQSLLQYTKAIKKHSFTALAGYSQEEFRSDWSSGYRNNFPNNALYELNAGSASDMRNGSSAEEWSLRSWFGRINYSFDGKYLFEVNTRYDGTSRFPSNNRWGLFPSVSAGWRISEESFIKDNATWIDNLKLRASWGQLGNQNIPSYPYQYVLATGANYTFGGNSASGIKLDKLPNTGVRWETTEITDLGLDLSILKGQLSMTLDYFDKTTSDILYRKSVSSVLGLSTSEYNAGEVNNKGFEWVLNYRTSVGKFNIGASPNFSYIKNKVTKLGDGLKRDIEKGLFVGEPIGAIYGYEADGLFVDAADVASYPTQPITAEEGFIRYKDISGPNGVPDGKVDATYDRKVIGSTTPKYSFGATLTADYSGFDFSMTFHGLSGFQKQMGSYQAFALYNGGNIQRWQADNAWTEENRDRNAIYPKISGGINQSHSIAQSSTYWNRNASFVRLKSVQLGYTFPKRITEKAKLNNLRVFYSGQNLFTYNHFYEGWDPEMNQGRGDNTPFYPITAIHTFGLNVKF